MRAVRSVEGGVAVVELDEPPGSGELLRMGSAGICASDLMYIRFGSRQVLGHELAGVLADGTPVAVEAVMGCGACPLCDTGRYNLCPDMANTSLGVTVDGGMADQFRYPRASLVELPAGLDVRDASIVEPTTVSWHALRLAGTDPTTRVAIVGAGALGLLAIPGAFAMGAEDVAIEARHPHQAQAAEALGAKVGTSGLYDVVVEAAGSEASFARCAELVAPGGTVVVLGVHTGPITLEWMPLFHREARVIPSLGYCSPGERREMDEVVAMLAGRPEIARAVITHRFPIEDAEEAFRTAADRAAGAIRVVVEPG